MALTLTPASSDLMQVRAAMYELYGIDREAQASWFKNRVNLQQMETAGHFPEGGRPVRQARRERSPVAAAAGPAAAGPPSALARPLPLALLPSQQLKPSSPPLAKPDPPPAGAVAGSTAAPRRSLSSPLSTQQPPSTPPLADAWHPHAWSVTSSQPSGSTSPSPHALMAAKLLAASAPSTLAMAHWAVVTSGSGSAITPRAAAAAPSASSPPGARRTVTSGSAADVVPLPARPQRPATVTSQPGASEGFTGLPLCQPARSPMAGDVDKWLLEDSFMAHLLGADSSSSCGDGTAGWSIGGAGSFFPDPPASEPDHDGEEGGARSYPQGYTVVDLGDGDRGGFCALLGVVDGALLGGDGDVLMGDGQLVRELGSLLAWMGSEDA